VPNFAGTEIAGGIAELFSRVIIVPGFCPPVCTNPCVKSPVGKIYAFDLVGQGDAAELVRRKPDFAVPFANQVADS